MFSEAALIGALQTGIIALLAAEKWIQRVTGRPSIESRVTALESQMNLVNAQHSKDMSEITHKIGELELDMREVKTVLRVRRRPRE